MTQVASIKNVRCLFLNSLFIYILQLLCFFFFFFTPALTNEHQGKERSARFCMMRTFLFTPHVVTLIGSITAAQLR